MYGYAFTNSTAKDLYAFRHNARLLIKLSTEITLAVLPDPRKAGDAKRGDLAGVYAFAFADGGAAHRLVKVDDDRQLVEFIAFGPHDAAYANAKHRVRYNPSAPKKDG